MSGETFEYSSLSDEIGRRNARSRIVSILILALGILSFLYCGYVEYLNWRAGWKLPFPPEPPEARHNWRMGGSTEWWYRIHAIRLTGDPLWESRPLTPAEQVDFRKFQIRRKAESDLSSTTVAACLFIPLIPLLFILALVGACKESSSRWKAIMAIVCVAQIAAATTFFRLNLFDVIGRHMD